MSLIDWSKIDMIKFNNYMYKVLHLGRTTHVHKYKKGNKWSSRGRAQSDSTGPQSE